VTKAKDACAGSPSSSFPSSFADPETSAVVGSSPITARQLTVLPDPDSPMIASVLPADTL